ncbi:OsmC family protein [Endothiovibrio diazotrophicus]
MSAETSFRIDLEQVEDYEFRVRFDREQFPDLLLDEPAPLGRDAGPNASRILGAAVANCLSASLLFCLRKSHQSPGKVKAGVTVEMARNERNRLRVGRIQVDIDVAGLDDPARMGRCLDLFEEFCVVTASIREGITVEVAVTADGRPLDL